MNRPTIREQKIITMNSFTVNEKENSKLKPAQEDMVWFMVPHGKYAFTNPVQLGYFFSQEGRTNTFYQL